MITILGKKYITDKEASQRYGFSCSWFQQQRSTKKLPNYVKFKDRGKSGRVLYPLDETDNYFHECLQVCE